MILPLGDSPNPRGFTPWMTWAIIALNVAVYLGMLPLAWQRADPRDPEFADLVSTVAAEQHVPRVALPALARQLLATTSRYDLAVFRLGFRPAAPSLTGILAGMFIHGGLLHLLGNMLFLWIYGDNVEHRLGRFGFLAAYVLTGIVAAAGDGILRFGSYVPTVGASGAISGVLGFYFTWFPHNRVRLLLFLPLIFTFELPARLVLGFYLVVSNILPTILSGGQGTGVSHGAHIGGFLAGWAAGVAMTRWTLRRREPELRGVPVPEAARRAPRQTFHDALDEDRLAEAAGMLFDRPRELGRRELTADDKLRLGDALLASGHPRGALAAYQRAIADHPAGAVQAHLRAARVLMDALNMPTAAYQHLYSALEERPRPEDAAEARILLRRLQERSRRPSAT